MTDIGRTGDPLKVYVRRTDTEIADEAALIRAQRSRPQQRPDLEVKRRRIMANSEAGPARQLRDALESFIDSKLAAVKETVSGDVGGMLDEILGRKRGELIGGPTGAKIKVTKEMCKRGTHQGRHGPKCLEG